MFFCGSTDLAGGFFLERDAMSGCVFIGAEALRGDPCGRLRACFVSFFIKSVSVACRAEANHRVYLRKNDEMMCF